MNPRNHAALPNAGGRETGYPIAVDALLAWALIPAGAGLISVLRRDAV